MTLARDSHLYVVPLLDEDAAGYVISHNIQNFDNGVVAAELDAPSNNEVRLVRFDGVSNKEALFSTSSIRKLLNYYSGGGLVRTYRLYPSVVTAWSTTNYFGYSDMVSDNPGSGNYTWNDPAMNSLEFKLQGLEV